MRSVYESRQREFLQLRASLREFVGRQTVTAEGQRIHLFANAGSVADASRAAGYGCDGIGLVRTEFLYLDRTSQPGEEEQFHAYRQILSAMRDKPVIIRTLDVGGDKELPYLNQPQEENPFLGCRGLRFSLREEDMFRVHLRAVLRASAYGKAQLLLPMVTGVEEIRRAREILEEEKEVLRRRRVAFDEHLPMGAMVETVAACLMAEAMAKEVDFFSIGTNDLTQYILGVDRGNARVATCTPISTRLCCARCAKCWRPLGIRARRWACAARPPRTPPSPRCCSPLAWRTSVWRLCPCCRCARPSPCGIGRRPGLLRKRPWPWIRRKRSASI